MVESSDALTAAIDELIAGVLGGGQVDPHEGQILDCKEDPSRRGVRGVLEPGHQQSDALAKTVADAASCFANADGGVVVVGVDDKATGPSAFIGTPCDTAWLQNRIRQLVGIEVQVMDCLLYTSRCV